MIPGACQKFRKSSGSKATDAWGIIVASAEIKEVVITGTMLRTNARQAEAERTGRPKVIHAEGE
jgi:regulator of protease activity HflC (stomatin/prohibitin superfamily)